MYRNKHRIDNEIKPSVAGFVLSATQNEKGLKGGLEQAPNPLCVNILRSGVAVNMQQLSSAEVKTLTTALTHTTKIPTPNHKFVLKTLHSFIIVRSGQGQLLIMAHVAGLELLQQIALAKNAKLIINNLINDVAVWPNTITPMTTKLFFKQTQIVNYICDNIFTSERIQNGTSSVILEAKPGCGKTFIGIGIINRCRVKTLIVCPTRSIIKNWCDVVKTAFTSLTIGKICDGVKTDGDIVIMTINAAIGDKFYNNLTSIEFFKQFGLVILDEVHLFNTNANSDVFRRAHCSRVLGLSATPNERTDFMDIVSHDYLGAPLLDTVIYEHYFKETCKMILTCPKNIINMVLSKLSYNGYSTKPDWKVSIQEIAYNAPDEFAIKKLNRLGKLDYSAIVSEVSADMHRNQLIATIVGELYRKGCNIFVMGDRRGIAALFTSYFKVVYGDVAAMILGGVSEAEMNRAANARICCSSFKAGGTGISFPRFNALVLAHPRKTGMKQILGRVFRGEDKTVQRYIIDIIDTKLFRSQFMARKRAYKLLYPQSTLFKNTVNWSSLTVDDRIRESVKNIDKTIYDASLKESSLRKPPL